MADILTYWFATQSMIAKRNNPKHLLLNQPNVFIYSMKGTHSVGPARPPVQQRLYTPTGYIHVEPPNFHA